jgi:hypothetical protein
MPVLEEVPAVAVAMLPIRQQADIRASVGCMFQREYV